MRCALCTRAGLSPQPPPNLELSTSTKPGAYPCRQAIRSGVNDRSDAGTEDRLGCSSGTPHANQTPAARRDGLGLTRALARWLWRVTFEPAGWAGAIRCRLDPAGPTVAGGDCQSGRWTVTDPDRPVRGGRQELLSGGGLERRAGAAVLL